jgi:hypothetical protein
MATPEETRAGDSGGAEALESMSEGDAAPISGSEDHARATTSTDSADAASAAACEKTAAAPSDGSETLEALAALRVADDAGDESGDSPVVPPAPDVFDRLGYGDSASESGDANDGADASETCDARDDDDDESDDEYDDERETDDAATLFLDTIVAVADGEIPLDAPALGSMARALAREVGVVLEDDDLTLLADAPRAVQVAVRRVSDLALALTLAPPDSVRRAPGGALVNSARRRLLQNRHARDRRRARGVRNHGGQGGGGALPGARARVGPSPKRDGGSDADDVWPRRLTS